MSKSHNTKTWIGRIILFIFGGFVIWQCGYLISNPHILDDNPKASMGKIVERINEDPSPKNIRRLLKYPADASYNYYKMAQLGAALSNHPEAFYDAVQSSNSRLEFGAIDKLKRCGANVFEHYPELKPEEFDERFKSFIWPPRYDKKTQ
ncbi:MAG: hypothetical protein AAF585_11830 [Verrucomicrobiota bacterium]